MWKFYFDAPAGCRIMKQFMWVVVTPKDNNENDLWWFYKANKFLPFTEHNRKKYGAASTTKSLHSFRAFKRFLRKHNYLKGYEVTLVTRYALEDYDLNIKAIWEEQL